MNASSLIILIFAFSLLAFLVARHRASAYRGQRRLSALPRHFGLYTAAWSAIPALMLLLVWHFIEPAYLQQQLLESLPNALAQQPADQLELFLNSIYLAIANGSPGSDAIAQQAMLAYQNAASDSRLLVTGLVLLLTLSGLILALSSLLLKLQARVRLEAIIRTLLALCSGVAIVTTLGIVLSVLFEALRFFDAVSIFDFVFGTSWSPQTAIREDQVGSSGSFGAVPLFVGTMLISAIALVIAVPVGLMSAIYLSEYATPRFRANAKPALEMLAAGIVMGVMIIPFVSSLSDDVISAVPRAMRDGSLGLGATQSETIRQVIIPAALPGIVGGVLLAASRAVGETMIVVMAAGLAAKMTLNPLDAVTTVTVQIVTLLTGDQEFDSPKTLAAFALGLMLFLTTLVLNVIALHIVRKYREEYE